MEHLQDDEVEAMIFMADFLETLDADKPIVINGEERDLLVKALRMAVEKQQLQ